MREGARTPGGSRPPLTDPDRPACDPEVRPLGVGGAHLELERAGRVQARLDRVLARGPGELERPLGHDLAGAHGARHDLVRARVPGATRLGGTAAQYRDPRPHVERPARGEVRRRGGRGDLDREPRSARGSSPRRARRVPAREGGSWSPSARPAACRAVPRPWRRPPAGPPGHRPPSSRRTDGAQPTLFLFLWGWGGWFRSSRPRGVSEGR